MSIFVDNPFTITRLYGIFATPKELSQRVNVNCCELFYCDRYSHESLVLIIRQSLTEMFSGSTTELRYFQFRVKLLTALTIDHEEYQNHL